MWMWRGKAVVAIYSHSDQIPQVPLTNRYEDTWVCRVTQNRRRERRKKKKRKTPKRYSTVFGKVESVVGGFRGKVMW
jgi:hypothetical protein